MMTHDEVSRRIPDYVLGLLSHKQLRAVEHHVAQCVDCQQTLRRERKLSQLVRVTIDTATKPEAIRLRHLMPVVTRRQSVNWFPQRWQKQLAPILLLILLTLGGLLLQRTLPEGSVPAFVATAHAATATTTNTPTATVAQSIPAKHAGYEQYEQHDFEERAVVGPAIPVPSPESAQALATPGPLPTPVAALVGIAE
ncbi:MAG: hypothetical protein GWP61_12645 [Chloroflexi bacterium]|jgi:anti-sigma factor RsiW|nr:hypothetical protein [Chloroflexota bacterium]